MKILRICLAFLSSLLIGGLVVGCTDTDSVVPMEEVARTNLTLRIGMSGSQVAEPSASSPANEGLKTLRIVVFSRVTNQIVYNQKFSAPASSSVRAVSDPDWTLPLTDIPVGESVIFAFGNEESLGMEYTNETLAKILKPENNYKVLFTDMPSTTGSYLFPIMGTSDNFSKTGIPISGRQDITIAPETATVDMMVTRAVAKLSFVLENATDAPISLKKTTFGPFISNQVYLFRQTELDVPASTEYRGHVFEEQGDGIEVGPRSKSSPLVAYMFPSNARKPGQSANPFNIALETTNNQYGALVFDDDLNYILRNTQLNILARITSDVNIDISFKVAQWDNYEVDVPDFN